MLASLFGLMMAILFLGLMISTIAGWIKCFDQKETIEKLTATIRGQESKASSSEKQKNNSGNVKR